MLTGSVIHRTATDGEILTVAVDDDINNVNGGGVRMSALARLQLERVDAAGRPAAMVATWLLGELTNVPGVSVRIEHPEVITLETRSPEDLARIQARITALLREPRFSRWAVREPSPGARGTAAGGPETGQGI